MSVGWLVGADFSPHLARERLVLWVPLSRKRIHLHSAALLFSYFLSVRSVHPAALVCSLNLPLTHRDAVHIP